MMKYMDELIKVALSSERVSSVIADRLGKLKDMAKTMDGTVASKTKFNALKDKTLRQLDNMLGHNGNPDWKWTPKGLSDYNRKGQISGIIRNAINKAKQIT